MTKKSRREFVSSLLRQTRKAGPTDRHNLQGLVFVTKASSPSMPHLTRKKKSRQKKALRKAKNEAFERSREFVSSLLRQTR